MSRPHADADVFRAVADPTRRAVLELLKRGPRTVQDIADRFDMSRPNLSFHLRVLRNSGLVLQRRLRPIARWLDTLSPRSPTQRGSSRSHRPRASTRTSASGIDSAASAKTTRTNRGAN